MNDRLPMAIRLTMEPGSSVLQVAMHNVSDRPIALPGLASFGATPRDTQLWVEVNAPKRPREPSPPEAKPLALDAASRFRRVRILKAGESLILSSADLKNWFALKPNGTYTATVYYQEKGKPRPEEALSAAWTVSDMDEPLVSPPLSFQVPPE